jgi:N-acetylglucosaminyl-diphospho-decaprenol L-rhamnosyltransferase
MDMVPSIDIVIVNWNAGTLLRGCLESIASPATDLFTLHRVVVVDNASSDGSIQNLQDLKLPLSIIRNGENKGFAAACNQGAQGSNSDFLLFLNPDTRVAGESLSKPIGFMQRPENQNIGIVGIQLRDEHGDVARSCARFTTPGSIITEIVGLSRLFPGTFPTHFMSEWDHRSSREVDQVMGAFFLVRRGLFESLHGFDERFFVYYEDMDFSFRASQAGMKSFYLSDAAAYHRGKGTTDRDKAARLSYVLRSRILYGYKHFSWLAASTLLLMTLLVEPIFRIGWTILKGSGSTVLETVRGYGRVWHQVPRLIFREGELKS